MFERSKFVGEITVARKRVFSFGSSLRQKTFGKVHLFLLGRVTWYSKWHRHPHHRKVHYSALALTCLLVASSIITTLFPNPSGVEAAVATWDFTHDNTKYDYDTNKVSMSGGNASLTNPGSATGASTNINAASGTTTNTSASFASANKEYLTIANNSSLQTGDIDFEVGVDVRLDSKTTIRPLLTKWESGKQEYMLLYNSNTDRFEFFVSSTGSNQTSIKADTLGIPAISTWYKVRAWHDSVNNTLNIQVNGGVIDSVAYSLGVYSGTATVMVGKRADSNVYFMDGRLDSLYFTKRISTTSEVTSLYNSGSSRVFDQLISVNGLDTFKTGLTSWWDFNEESGTRQDAKGTNHLTSAADPIIAPPSYGSELMVNSGFETAGAGGADVFGTWVDNAGDGVIADEATVIHSGSHASKLTGGATPSGTPLEYQTVAVTEGASYYYSFWSRGDGTNSGRYSIANYNSSSYVVPMASTNNPTTSYQLFTGQFTAPAGGSVATRLFAPNVTGGIAYFDDISIKQITTAAVNNGGFDLRPTTGGEKTNISTVSATRASNVATVVATAHGLKNNDVVTITGFGDTTLNGTGKTVTVVDVDTFTYASTGADINTSEILGNIGFETAGAGGADVFGTWIEGAGDGAIDIATVAVHSGSKAAKLTAGSAPASYPYLYHTFIVAPGAVYNYSFWMRGDGTNTGRYGLIDVTNSATILSQPAGGNTTTSYTQVIGTFTAPAGCTSVQLYFRTANVTGAITYYDDFSITRVTAVTTGRITTDVFSGWNESASGATVGTVDTATPYVGSYSAKFMLDGSESSISFSNPVTVIGKRYQYSLYGKRDATSASIRFSDSAGVDSTTLTTSWANYAGSYKATETSFRIIRLSSPGASLYIDQVTLTSLGPTAEAGIAAGNAIDGNFAAGFNGTSQYLSVASNASLQTGGTNWSTWGWVNMNIIPTTNATIISKGTIGSSNEYQLIYFAASAKFALFTSTNGTAWTSVVTDNVVTPVVGLWYFVRSWYDGGKFWISVNGNTPVSATIADTIAGQGVFTIGALSNATFFFPGRIDGVGFSKRLLTTDEATSLYNNGKGLKYASLPDSIKNDSALKGYWNLDEKSGTRYDSTSNHNNLTDNGTVTQVQGVNYYEGTVGTVFDASGNNNTFTEATLSKRPTYCSICLNGRSSMLFDGVDDALVATGDKIGAGDVTVTAVINARGAGGTGQGTIIHNGQFFLAVSTVNGFMAIWGVSTGGNVFNNSVSNLSFNTSYVITVTRTSAGLANIYVNGALSGPANQNSGTPIAGSDTYIGNRAAGDRGFDGNIGTVQIYNSILDPLHRNNLEKTLGAKYGITVANDTSSSSAASSLYPTISLNQSLQYATISSFTPTLSSSSTGTPRYQLTTDGTSAAGSSSTASYYYHNGTNWVSANKYNAYQSNAASEIDSNISTLKTDIPSGGGNYLKWRAFLITDGIDNPSIISINSNYISDTKAPLNPTTLVSTITPLDSNTPQAISTNEWHNSTTLHLTWPTSRNSNEPETDQNRGGAIDQINENEIYSGVSSYNLYFGEDPSADPTTTSGLINANSSPHNQATTTIDLTNLPLETGKTYYFLIETKDVAGNIAHTNQRAAEEPPVLDTPLLTYKYDSTLPTPIEYVQVAQVGCSTSPTFDLTWPASTDSLSGLKYYQYKVGVNGTINTTTATTITVAPERENENVFYVRPVDNANNSNPTQSNTIWQSTVFCSTQSVTLTSGPTYTKTLSTLTVDFETSRPTTSKVEVYKIKEDESLEKVSTGEDTTLSLTHSVQVPNLTPDTNYKYKLFFKDQNNNEGESNYYEASTDLISLSHTTTNNLENSLSSLTIIFETTKPAKARVEVYQGATKQQEVSTQDYTLNHHLTINNLTSGTTYTYKIFYIDQENNNYESSTYTTTTTTVGIVDLPTITSGPNSVNVTWKTNLPTTGQVQIKEGDTYKEPQGHITYLTDHNVTIQGLKSEKPYKLRIIWTDQSNKTDQTGWFEANTAQSPLIKDPKAEVLSPSSVLLSWETNYASTCTVNYGVGETFGKEIVLNNEAKGFSLKLENLTSGSNYQFRIDATTEDNADVTAIATASLPPLPAISALRFEPLKDSSHATYKAFWTTNIETSSAIYYKVQGAGEYKSKASAELTKEHEILLDSMEDQSSYELYAQGADKYGNVTKSDLNTIKTPNDSRPPKITNLSTSVKSSGFADSQKAQVIVSWDTDELTTSQVEYANGIEGTEYQNRTKEETALSTSHVVVISDLEPSKIYHLRAISKDQANNPAYSQDTTVITGKVQKSVLDIILASLQRSLGWITKLFK